MGTIRRPEDSAVVVRISDEEIAVPPGYKNIEVVIDGDEPSWGAAATTAINSGERLRTADLVWLCGYYRQLALALAVFQPPMPRS